MQPLVIGPATEAPGWRAGEVERPAAYPAGTVLIVIPALNEEESLAATVAACRPWVPASDILVVDDGSTDRTSEIARGLDVQTVRLAINLGIGGAVQTGYRRALDGGYRVAVQVDADGQHDPAELPKLIDPVLDGTCDMAVGSRYLRPQGFQSTRLRRLGSRLLSRLLAASTGVRIRDCTSGFRAINRKVLTSFTRYYPADYPEPESLAILLHGGARVLEVPVTMRPRRGGASTIRRVDSLVYMAKVLSVIAAYGTFAGTFDSREYEHD